MRRSAEARRIRAAGPRRGQAHILRHGFAKNRVNAGVTLEKVAGPLGHAWLDAPRIDTAPSQGDLEQAVAQMGE